RAVLWKRQPGGRGARVAAGMALVALALALPVPRSFAPWNTVSGLMAYALPIHQPAPLRPGARYDARELLSAGRMIGDALRWRLYLNHGLAAPLVLICLVGVGAHKLRKRR